MSIHGPLGIIVPFIKQMAFNPPSRQEDNVHIWNSKAGKLRLGGVRGSSQIISPSPDQDLSLTLSSQPEPVPSPSQLLVHFGDTVLATLCRQLQRAWSCPWLCAPGGVVQLSLLSWLDETSLPLCPAPSPEPLHCLLFSACPFSPKDGGCWKSNSSPCSGVTPSLLCFDFDNT